MTTSLASQPVFSHVHILLTAAVTAVFSFAAAWWRLGHRAWVDIAGVTLAAGVSVFLWRTSANMPQLNADGLPGFSANDWLAPAITYLFISVYGALRPPADTRRFAQARALAVLASLAVNVITI
jgi:hypothetical protein